MTRSQAVTACILLGILALRPQPLTADEGEIPIGRKVESFVLEDYRGKEYSLEDFADHELVVLAFLGTECPLAKLYGPRLAELSRCLEPQGFVSVGLNANCQDSLAEIAAYAWAHEIEFPILKDLQNQVADQVGAIRTPEVFLLDRDRVIRYWGRIDDQYGIGYARDAPQQNDLQAAIDSSAASLLAGLSLVSIANDQCSSGRRR